MQTFFFGGGRGGGEFVFCLDVLLPKIPFGNASTFHASYFNRIVKSWNLTCKLAPKSSFSSIDDFKKLFETNSDTPSAKNI